MPLAKKRPSPNSATAHAHADASEPKEELSPEEKSAIQAYSDQQSVITKLRGIAEDAKSYENDTGVHVLQIGFPLLSLPPGSFGQAIYPAYSCASLLHSDFNVRQRRADALCDI